MSSFVSGLAALALASSLAAATARGEKPAGARPGREADASPARIRDWIEKLGHPEFKLRAQAQAELRTIGLAAVPALRGAAQTSASLEVRLRARQTAETIERDHWKRIADAGKAATALLLVPPGVDPLGRGGRTSVVPLTAVCVHSSGLFVALSGGLTVTTGEPIPLILQPGEKSQQRSQARVVRVDRSLDLALLQVEGKGPFPALPLGEGEAVSELAEVLTLAFPSPTVWTPGAYPAPDAPRGVVSSVLMREGETYRVRFELEEAANELVGPVLDTRGNLAGLVTDESSALERFTRAAEIGEGETTTRSYAVIPTGLLRRFLEPPILQFSPPVVRDADRHKPATFRVTVAPTFPSSVPDKLELVFPGEETRRFEMTSEGGAFVARAVPLPETSSGRRLRITVVFEEGRLEAQIEDRTIDAGSTKMRLSTIRSLTHEPKQVQATLADGKKVTLPTSALEGLAVRIGGVDRPIPFAHALQTTLRPPEPTPAIPCLVVASRAGKEVAQVEGTVVILQADSPFTLLFDSSRSRLAVPSFIQDAGQPFTVEVLLTPIQDGFQALLGSPGGPGVALELVGGDDPRWALAGYGGGTSMREASKIPAPLKRGTHVAGVFDGSSMTLYVNGKQQLRRELPPGNPSAGSLPTFSIGASTGGSEGRGGNSFLGLLEGVRISRGARYAKDFTPPGAFDPDRDTSLLLRMNEGTGSVCYDASGHQHHASLGGVRWIEVPPGGFTPDTLPAVPSPAERPTGPGFTPAPARREPRPSR